MSMTTDERFWQLLEQSGPKMAATNAHTLLPHQPGIFRSSSDSLVMSKRRREIGVGGCGNRKGRTENQDTKYEDIVIQTNAQGTLMVVAPTSPPSKSPSRAKARHHHLQLPPFHAFGIAVPYPTSILTPPDEPSTMDWKASDMDESGATPTASEPLPSNVHPSNKPQSLFSGSSILGASNDTPTQGPIGVQVSPSAPLAHDQGSGSSNSSAATEIASNAPWLEGALKVIREYTDAYSV